MMELRYSPYQRKKSSRKAKATTATTFRHRAEGLKWGPEEDSLLRDGVCEYGGKKWKAISERIERRSPEECNKRWNELQSLDAVVKRPWTEEEDAHMLQLVKKYGASKWAVIASYLQGRNGKQCRERWHNQLNPAIKKTPWTDEENAIILTMQAQLGNCWAKITSQLPGRTDNAVKNHWHSSLKALAKRALGDGGDQTASKRCKPKNKSRMAKSSRSSKKLTQSILSPSVDLAACADEETGMFGFPATADDGVAAIAVPAFAADDAAMVTGLATPAATPVGEPVVTPSVESELDCLASPIVTDADRGSFSPDAVSSVDNFDLFSYAQSYQDGMLRARAVINNILDPMGMGSCSNDSLGPPRLPDACASVATLNHSIQHSMEVWYSSDDDFYGSRSNHLSSADPTSPAQPPFGLDELLYDPLHDVCGDGAVQVTTGMESSDLVLSAPLGEVARVYKRSTHVPESGACITYCSPFASTTGSSSVPSPMHGASDLSSIDQVDEILSLTEGEPLIDGVKQEIPPLDCGYYAQEMWSCASSCPLDIEV